MYRSTRFGDIKLRLADPNDESERRLFAHYVWNAGVLLGELVGQAGKGAGRGKDVGEEVEREGNVRKEEDRLAEGEEGDGTGRIETDEDSRAAKSFWARNWSVRGESVLELGAGE